MNDKTKTGDPDGGSKTPPEGSDEVEPKSLSELLSEWPDDSKQADTKPALDDDNENKESRLESLERRANESDMSDLVSRVKGELEVDDWMVRAWILNEAAGDPRMDDLWDQRGNKQGVLDKIINDALIPGFKKYAEGKILPVDTPKPKKGDKGLAAAVNAARKSDSTPHSLDDVDWSDLSDSEFQTKKSEVFRAAKAGELN